MLIFASLVYFLCFVTSFVAMALLVHAYRRDRTRLLLISAVGFVIIALNNLTLFIDIVILPDTDLLPLRRVLELLGVGILLIGLIWETE